jgi:predicted dehydrogenase
MLWFTQNLKKGPRYPMGKELRVGLTGCGHLGKIHCRLIKDISQSRIGIKFSGIYDIDKTVSEQVSKELSLNVFRSEDDLLENIDTLVIVTPTSTHFDIAKSAVERGINLFIEKPVTSTIEEARKLTELSKLRPVKIQVGHVERFNPALTSLSKYVLNPMFIESHRLAQFNPRGTDVSVIQDLMIHDIDIILNLVNSPIKKIDANGVAVISDEIDIANARLTFDNGCTANITSSRISLKKMRKMRIFQNNAYISIDFLKNRSEIFRLADISAAVNDGTAYPVSETKKIILEQPVHDTAENPNPIKAELESFFNSIIDDKPVKVSLEDARRAVEIADEIIKIISSSPK